MGANGKIYSNCCATMQQELSLWSLSVVCVSCHVPFCAVMCHFVLSLWSLWVFCVSYHVPFCAVILKPVSVLCQLPCAILCCHLEACEVFYVSCHVPFVLSCAILCSLVLIISVMCLSLCPILLVCVWLWGISCFIRCYCTTSRYSFLLHVMFQLQWSGIHPDIQCLSYSILGANMYNHVVHY